MKRKFGKYLHTNTVILTTRDRTNNHRMHKPKLYHCATDPFHT